MAGRLRDGKVALVTGASSGIGEETARGLHAEGFRVYGAARRVDRMTGLASGGVEVLAMDVTDPASRSAGVERVLEESGRLDVLVNNAGYGSYGAVEDVPLDEARAQLEVNVLGAAGLCALVLPHMRRQRSGTIVNISSMGGRIHTPLGGWYHASKWALEGLSDCLRLEVAPFGVHVVLVEPGATSTEWGAVAAEKLLATSGASAYAGQASAMARRLTKAAEPGAGGTSSPSHVAQTVVKAATARRPRTRYVVGRDAHSAILARQVLPDRTFDAAMRLMTGVPRG
jgi:NAD(P)-dependent dehydrogenase (short-subunit alcohol dehydrogenase family)